MTLVLGLETSCDETAAAVVDARGAVRSSVVASQHELHQRYRGVVPEIASRAHLQRLLPVIQQAVDDAGVGLDRLDAVAVGNRPGLIGSLIVGVSAAKALAWALGKPLVGIDHVEAHLHAASLTTPGGEGPDNAEPEGTAGDATDPSGVGLGLVVSGGHTSLYRIDPAGGLTRLGRTIDDAVGEAFDKAAVILGLGYPGGPAIDRLAARGDPSAFKLPRSMLGPESLDFSFSGLKTALLYAVRGTPTGRGQGAVFERSAEDLDEQTRADLAASFQAAAVDAVIRKLARAAAQLEARGKPAAWITLGGGVSANSLLRREARALGQRLGASVRIPPMDLCVDNAAMIAGLAVRRLAQGRVDDLHLPAIATTSV